MLIKRTIGEAYIRYRLRTGWGSAYLSEIEGLRNALQSGGVIVLLISAYWHVLVPLWVLILAWGIQKVVEYIIGYIDEKYLGWSAAQNRYSTANMNPHFAEMMDRIKNIETICQKSKSKKENHLIS